MNINRNYVNSKGLSDENANNGRPNVILIMTDQQTYSALGAAGNEEVKTPNLDRLAAIGAFFTNFQARRYMERVTGQFRRLNYPVSYPVK